MSATAPRAGLAAIVAVVGGELHAGGRRANIPAPGHSAADRSVSLLLDGDRVVAHGFGGADWRAVLADLQARGLLDREGRLTGAIPVGTSAPAAPAAPARVRVAARLWAEGVALRRGGGAARHLLLRGVVRDPSSLTELRAHPAAPVSVYRPGRLRRPALLAAVRDAGGALTAVEVTYLDGAGRRASDIVLSRKTVGVLPPGSAVRLDAPGADLLVAEGVFSALSAGALFGWPCWALLSTSNLRRWRAPVGVRRVLIAGDRGPDGERSAGLLAAALRAQGLAAIVRLPPAGRGDWNDLLRTGG